MWPIILFLIAPPVAFSPEPYGGIILSYEALDAADKVQTEMRRLLGVNSSLVSICVAKNTNVPAYCLHFKEHKTVHVSRPWRLIEWYFDLDTSLTCVCEGLLS